MEAIFVTVEEIHWERRAVWSSDFEGTDESLENIFDEKIFPVSPNTYRW
jgi:hypothetical protein